MPLAKSIFGPKWGSRVANAGLAIAKLAGYEAGQSSRTRQQHGRYNSNPNSTSAQIERIWAQWNAEYIAKNSAFGIGYLRQTLNYCSPLGWLPNTGDSTLNGEVRDYVNEWMEDGGLNCSGWEAWSRSACVEMPVRGDSALIWHRDESRLRLMEASGDQIGELYTFTAPYRQANDGQTYFAGMYFDSHWNRTGMRVYERGYNQVYCNPQDYPASDVIYFQDNLFRGVRGMTRFHGAIVTLSKSDTLFGFGMDSAQKQAKTGVVVRNELGGPLDGELSYDTKVDDNGNVIYIEKTFDGAQTEYQYSGDSYQVIQTQSPGPELIAGCQYADERSALSLGFPYSFLVNSNSAGGAGQRLEIAKATQEIERMTRLQTRPFKKMVYVILMDAIERGIFSGTALRYALTKGSPRFPKVPSADAFRDTQDDIASNRAGIESRSRILARYQESFEDILRENTDEAIAISVAAQDANRKLVAMTSPIDGKPYTAEITAFDIAQSSDQPQQFATAEQIASGKAPTSVAIPSSATKQVTDNPPNVTAS